MNEKITLSGVPETMLQTVYARARESSGRGAIRDRKAEEIIDRLDYVIFLLRKGIRPCAAASLPARSCWIG